MVFTAAAASVVIPLISVGGVVALLCGFKCWSAVTEIYMHDGDISEISSHLKEIKSQMNTIRIDTGKASEAVKGLKLDIFEGNEILKENLQDICDSLDTLERTIQTPIKRKISWWPASISRRFS